MVLPNWIKKVFMFPVLVIVILVLFSLIEPMKTMSDTPRSDMNCPNTPTFNQTAWDSMSELDHLNYSTGCYAINWDMILFIGGLCMIAVIGWWGK